MADGAPPKLSDKQSRFVDEYLIDLNATAAYRRAGYKARTDAVAASSASDLLRNPKVAAAVAAAVAARAARTEINQDWVLTRLVRNAERAAQAVPVVDGEGNPTGEYRYDGAVVNGALKLLGQHLGLFTPKPAAAPAVSVNLNLNMTLDELRKLAPDELLRLHRRALGLEG